MKNLYIAHTQSRDIGSKQKVYFYVLLLGSIILSIWILLLFRTETNTSYYHSFKFFSLPALVLSFYIVRRFIPRYLEGHAFRGIFEYFMMLAFTGMFLLLQGNSIILAGNAWFSDGKMTVFSGKLEKKWLSYGAKSTIPAYNIRFYSDQLQRTVDLTTSETEYKMLKIGQIYKRDMIRGAFNVLYTRS